MANDESSYRMELKWEEVGVIVEALRIQRERWHDTLMKKLANDPSVSAIRLDDIQAGISRHEELLKRLPDHGLTL